MKFQETIYVLHAFHKKSKKEIITPKNHLQLIEQRLQTAKEYHAQHQKP